MAATPRRTPSHVQRLTGLRVTQGAYVPVQRGFYAAVAQPVGARIKAPSASW
jgi:hypothetical protein